MSYIDQKIREMDYYFESVQRSVMSIKELMEKDHQDSATNKKIKRK